MKRFLQMLAIVACISFGMSTSIFAQLDYRWIGGGNVANWNDNLNWETRPSGTGDPFTTPSLAPPSENDDVIFDDQSFNPTLQTVTINVTDAKCKNINWSVSSGAPTLEGNGKLTIFGSLNFSPNINNQFTGTFEFQATTTPQAISSSSPLGGTVLFNKAGATWTLGAPLTVNNFAIQNGTLDVTNSNHLITVLGNWTVGSGGNFSSRAGKVIFDGTGSVNIVVPTNVRAFNDLEINKDNGNVNINPESSKLRIGFKIGNSLTITRGALYDWGNQISKDGTGTGILNLANSTALFIGDDDPDPINFPTPATVFPIGFTANLDVSSRVDYRDRTSPQLVSAVPEYGNLTFSNSPGSLRTKRVTHPSAPTSNPTIPLRVRGDLAIDNSIRLEDNGYQITGVSGRKFTMDGNSELYLGTNTNPIVSTSFPLFYLSNNTNNDIVLSAQSTVSYNAGVNQDVRGVVGNGYGNLIINGSGTKNLDANTIIQGNLTINTNSTFSANNREITIKGNWISRSSNPAPNGTNLGSFNPGTGTVIFNGSANQIINASTTNPFYNIRMSTGNLGTAGVTLNSKVNINNTVFFDSGRIRTSINNELVFPDYPVTAPIFNAKDESHVVGPVIKLGNDDFIFPIGDGTLYRPAGITSVANNGNFRARYFNQSPNSIPAPLGPATTTSTSNVIPSNPQQPLAGKVDEYEYWTLESLSGPRNAKPYLSWDERSIPANVRSNYFPSIDQMVVALWNEGNRRWDNKGGVNQDGTRSKGSVTATEAVNAANLTVFTLSTVFNALPIELLYFRAEMAGKGVQLSWATAKEINNDYFTIEKSEDGVTFTDLLQVDGAGNSKDLLKYAATDANPYPGVTYYRLKQTDFDGKFEHSSIVAVQNGEAAQTQLKIAQVSSREAKIMYRLAETEQGILSLYDSKGVQLWSKSVSGNAAYNEQIVSLPQSLSGFYVVSLQSAGGVIMKKLIIL